jgi:Peptidase C39 family
MVSRERLHQIVSTSAKTFWKRRIPFVIIVVVVGIAAWSLRGRNSLPIPAQGGELFQNFTALETPLYLQDDKNWSGEEIGGSGEKLVETGCAICSLAMALDHFGVHYAPKELNTALKVNRGYTWRGWLRWQAVSTITSNKVIVEIIPKPSHADIDAALRSGNPVVAKILINRNTPHWVLIVGTEGMDYLIRDPLGNGHSLEPLSKYDSDIFGIRIVKGGG